MILLYFLLASERWLVLRTVAAIRRPRARALVLAGVRQAQRDIGLFISTMSLVNVALGVATGLALWLIGLPNPVLWGTTTAVLAFIPYLGPLLITLLLLLAGSVTFGTGAAMLGPPAAFLVLHGIEANFLSPMIMGHRLRLRPVFVFLSVMVWGWLWGIAGAFLAVPLLLALRAVCKRLPALAPGLPLPGRRLEAPVQRRFIVCVTGPAQDRRVAAASYFDFGMRLARMPPMDVSSRPMRIAYVTETYPPELNGVSLTVERTVRFLRARGHTVELIRPRQPGEARARRRRRAAHRRLRDSGVPRAALRPRRASARWCAASSAPGPSWCTWRRPGRWPGRRWPRRAPSASRRRPTSAPTSTSTAATTASAFSPTRCSACCAASTT